MTLNKVFSIVLISLIFLTLYIPSGSAALIWSKTYGGTNAEYGFSFVQTSDDGYAIVGSIITYGSGSSYSSDSWLIKTDVAGDLQWSKTFGGAGTNLLSSLVETSDGGFALGGFTNSSGGSEGDMWLVKTNSKGDIQWSKNYGDTNHEIANSIVQTSDGGFALAGAKGPGGDFNDFCLVKTDSAGDLLWSKTYGGEGNDVAQSLVQTTDGGYAMVGFLNNYPWLVRVDSTGSMQWNKTYGELIYGESGINLGSVIQSEDGGYVLVGYNNQKAWLVKTDSSGNLQWNKTYDQGFVAYSVVQTNDGGYALAGQVVGNGVFDFWLAKTDNTGNVQWAQNYVGGQGEVTVMQTSDGGYALLGSINPTGANYDSDIWLIKTDTNGITASTSTHTVPEFSLFAIIFVLLISSVFILFFRSRYSTNK